MSRPFATPLLVPMLAVLALAACRDTPTQAPSLSPDASTNALLLVSIPGCNTVKIAQIATSLLPVATHDPELNLSQSIVLIVSLPPSGLALAQSAVLRLSALLSDPRVLAKMSDPNGAAPPTKGQAVSSLVNELFLCVKLPPPGDISGAFTPGGGAKVITGTTDDTLRTNDGFAFLAVPAGAVTGDHLFTIAPKPDKAILRQCLPNMPGQYNQCYAYNVSPVTTFAVPVTIAICTLDETGALYGTPSAAVHNRLHLASLDHDNAGRIRIYPRKAVPLACAGASVVSAPSQGLGDRLLGAAWPRVYGFVDRVTKPFRPSIAYAIDGVGTEVLAFTDYTTVDNVSFESSFEPGETRVAKLPGALPEPVLWTLGGYWNQNTLVGVTNSAVAAGYVNLAPGDGSAGALPAPVTGAYALWFGDPGTGNYGSPFASGATGGTSTAPRSGVAYSPYFSIPAVSNQLSLSLKSWFEIESVNPRSFDSLAISLEDSVAATVSTIRTLNPPSDPGGNAATPFTSGGFNAPPVWQPVTIDVSAFAGKTVRVRFSFNTRDQLYNGFRGWVIDDVRLFALDAIAPPPPIIGAAATRVPAATFNVAADTMPARVWQP